MKREELVTAYAQAIVNEDANAQIKAMNALRSQGYSLAGYVGAPIIYRDHEEVGQLTFHFTKAMTFRRCNPFTVSLTEVKA